MFCIQSHHISLFESVFEYNFENASFFHFYWIFEMKKKKKFKNGNFKNWEVFRTNLATMNEWFPATWPLMYCNSFFFKYIANEKEISTNSNESSQNFSFACPARGSRRTYLKFILKCKLPCFYSRMSVLRKEPTLVWTMIHTFAADSATIDKYLKTEKLKGGERDFCH